MNDTASTAPPQGQPQTETRPEGRPPSPKQIDIGGGIIIQEWDEAGADYNPITTPADKERIRRQKREWAAERGEAVPRPRTGLIHRRTAETQIELCLDLDGSGKGDVQTGVGFFDHMLTLLARHGLFDLFVRAKGDLHVEAHHTVEDVGICLGKALAEALGDKAGTRRYGDATVPMDEALVTAAVDLSGRPFCVWKADVPLETLGTFSSQLAEEFWRAVSSSGAFALHVVLHHGKNTHHIVEAVFKAAARALRAAVEADPRSPGVPSTKGVL
jgi:imidazoleglycerol-phosphate dehydratase